MVNQIPAPLVKDVMTTVVVTLAEEDNLEGIAKAMQDFHFRHVPVVDGKRLVGMVTQSDLLRLSISALQSGQPASAVQQQLEQRTFVAEVMVRNPPTIGPEATLGEASRILVETRIGALPVVDADDNLIGIVSEIDILKAVILYL
jgi:acetoin utilization protein AcuB